MTQASPVPGLAERLAEALRLIKDQARPEQLAALARFAIDGEGRLGLSVPQMRTLGKQLGRDHALALALWDTAIPDAQIVAGLIADPAALTLAQMNHWTRSMPAWDVCDPACSNAFRKSPLAWARIPVWVGSREEFVKRAEKSARWIAADALRELGPRLSRPRRG
jgi:3-methyladenine DNA glycosylase AlkD